MRPGTYLCLEFFVLCRPRRLDGKACEFSADQPSASRSPMRRERCQADAKIFRLALEAQLNSNCHCQKRRDGNGQAQYDVSLFLLHKTSTRSTKASSPWHGEKNHLIST